MNSYYKTFSLNFNQLIITSGGTAESGFGFLKFEFSVEVVTLSIGFDLYTDYLKSLLLRLGDFKNGRSSDLLIEDLESRGVISFEMDHENEEVRQISLVANGALIEYKILIILNIRSLLLLEDALKYCLDSIHS